ncbi:uncharacterized protein LOC113388188 [Ctenocephalides felis]|uniref:uncharacterized protein LOC113388188 n=1 Tax=Ctenocephalides felis TaxID=7515 RepID=UPI000E6E26E0|nr:uncharacterized protein LOC113388188 [Ctenocephalides felis]
MTLALWSRNSSNRILYLVVFFLFVKNAQGNYLEKQIQVKDYGAMFSQILKVLGSVTEAEDYSDTIFLIDVDGIKGQLNMVFDKNAFIIYDITNKDKIPPHNFLNSSYLYVIDKPKLNVYQMLQRFYKWSNYDVQTPVNVYVHNITLEEELDCYEWMSNIFKKLWLKNVTRILIIFWSNITHSLQWFTYHVFLRQIYNQTGVYSLSKNISLSNNNMYGHLLDICLYDLPPASIMMMDNVGNLAISGTDGYAMKTILKAINATYRITFEDGKQESRLSASRNNLINHRCDVLFTSQYFIDNSKPDLQYIYPLQEDSWCIMVPKAGKKNDVNRFIKPFGNGVWFTTVVFIVLIGLAWYWFFRFYDRVHRANDEISTLLILCGLFLNYCIHIKWRDVGNSARFLMMAVSIYSFFITNSYLGLLFGSLMTPIYNEDMHTLRDVNKSGLRVIVHDEELQKWVEQGLNNTDLSRMFLPESNMSKILEMRNANNINYAYAVRYRYASFLLELDEHIENGRPIYHIVEECFLPTFVSYVVTIDFPFARRIEYYQSLLKQAGLYEHWSVVSSIDYNQMTASVSARIEEEDPFDSLRLTTTHLEAIFYVWLLGICISCLIFLLERTSIRKS